MVSIKSLVASAVLLPFLASAIEIIAPALGSYGTKGSNLTVTWIPVDTDPTTFGVLLVNFVYVCKKALSYLK